MAVIVTRAGKGSPLTTAELDLNFTNLNTDKLEAGDALGTPSSVTLTNATGLPTAGLVDNAVDNTKLRDSAGLSVIGRGANSTGDPADIVAGTNKQVLRRDGSDLAFGAVDLASNQAVTGTLPVNQGGTGITSFGTGVATWLGTPSSANLAAAVTDETGTGALVFATNATLVNPALGTPASGVVTNLTGTASININGTVGATTPAAGAFTTLNTSGAVVFNEAGANVDFRVEGDTEPNLLFVDASADNVGIGTSSPSNRLDIAGGGTAIRVRQAGGGASDTALQLDGTSNFGDTSTLRLCAGRTLVRSEIIDGTAQGDTDLTFHTRNSGVTAQRLRITQAGNVGIGTSSPVGRLNIAGELGAVIGGGGSGVRMTNTSSSNFASISAGIVGIANNGMDFSIDGVRSMVISGAGNVGIGTTSPDLPLTVSKTNAGGTGGAIRIINPSLTDGTKTSLIFTNTTTTTANSARIDALRDSVGQNIVFSQNDSERLRIDSAGNVGIGTTAPAATLHVAGTDAIIMPVGTTAQRPASPQTGMIRQNSTTGEPEWYDTVVGAWQPFGSSTSYAVEYLVIAGGGAGGGSTGGGGGAGGYRSSVSGESSGGGASAESALSLTQNTVYTVTIGAGGAAPLNAGTGGSGNNTTFGPITAIGGGGGASFGGNGVSGGSGGGAAGANNAAKTGGSATTNQGFAGGNNNVSGTSGQRGSGGGGGAEQLGANGTTSSSGNGGNGISSSITGSAVARAGGGGGGSDRSNSHIAGLGGSGGGGDGGQSAGSGVAVDGSLGAVNTGSGGGGGNSSPSPVLVSGNGGDGGSGIVIIRYLGPQQGTGGTVTSSGGYTIHTFTSSGTFAA